ncbi:MAG TPA: tetratricopeptide repeat protein, partial [Azospirillum sp.]
MADSIDAAAGHFHAGRMAEAIAACRAVLRVDPRQAEALNLLGAALFSIGDHDAAGAVLDEAVRIAPGHDTALTNLIVVRLHRRAWAAAERCLRRLAVLDPGRPFAWSRLGTALQETGDLEGSIRGLLRAVRLTPSSDTDRFNLGTVRILAGDFDAAVDTLRRVIAANPNGVLAHVRTGEMLLRLGRPDQAATAFQRALRLDPGDGDAANGLAR